MVRRLAIAVGCLILAASIVALAVPAHALATKKVLGGFEMVGFLDTVVGFQSFGRTPTTEITSDGSFAGVLGEWLPGVASAPADGSVTGTGQDVFGIFVPKFELDIIKAFGERARLRVDTQFLRGESGGPANGIVLSHAYAAVRLSHDYNIELLVGRFGLQAGYEPFQSYNNDTVSWSIMWRAGLYPPATTGLQISANLTDTFTFFFTAGNGIINNTTQKDNQLPCFLASLEWNWGNEAHPNIFVVTPYIGPEITHNRPLTYGVDATLAYWLTDRWKLGLEAAYLRANAPEDSMNTDYASALFNLVWRVTPKWFTVAKYCFARQFETGTNNLNLTGTKQSIHEMSAGFGYQLTDGTRVKGEFRYDVIAPTSAPTQQVPGAAIEYTMNF